MIKNHLSTLSLLTALVVAGASGQITDERGVNQKWRTDLSKHSVPLSEFKALLPRDGIPPIDRPSFIGKREALEEYFEHEPVIAIEINGEAKAYPLNVLTYHEIVNDELGGVPISSTYCPLCNAAIVYDRRLEIEGNERVLDFGVSGMLRKSDLVMWDRQTESWWQQLTGIALAGELTGRELTMLPALLISLGEFLDTHPEGQVLSKNTGFREQQQLYGVNVYEGYDDLATERPRLFFDAIDERLRPMERVIDVNAEGRSRVYPLTLLQELGVINDTIGSSSVVLFHQFGTRSNLGARSLREASDIGSVTAFSSALQGRKLSFNKNENGFVDDQTGSTWSISGRAIDGPLKGAQLRITPHGHHFAFAWFAFHPESEVYQPSQDH
jgi:hypothetical protein